MTPRPVASAEDYRARMVKAMSEEELTRNVLDLCAVTGWTWKYHPYDSRKSTQGMVDWIFANPSKKRIIFRELKGGRGKLSPWQTGVLALFQHCGMDAGVWTPTQWFDGTIEQELRGQEIPR